MSDGGGKAGRAQGVGVAGGDRAVAAQVPGKRSLVESETEVADTASASKIVDAWLKPADGQLTKTEFLDTVQKTLIAMVDQEMGVAGRATACPYIQQWFSKNILRSAAEIEKLAQRFTGLKSPANAHDYIAPAVARVQAGVHKWKDGGVSAISGDLAAAGLGDSGGEAPLPGAAAGAPQLEAPDAGTIDKARMQGGGAAMQVAAALGQGEALDGATAGRMESALGDSVAGVRVHTGPAAQQIASQAGAKAVAVGRDIAFGAGEYQPGTPVGDALLAHELTHTAQQRDGADKAPGDEATEEREANQTGLAAITGKAAERKQQNRGRGLALRRCADGPTKVTELRGKAAEQKLAELGASLVTDPATQKPIVGSAMRFILTTTPSPTKNVGMYEWNIVLPSGQQISSGPNRKQPDPIPKQAPANGMFVNDYDANATTLRLFDLGAYKMDAHVRAGVDAGNGAFEGFELHIERTLDVIPLQTATDTAYGKLAGKDKEEDFQKFHDTMDMQLALLRPGGPDKQSKGQHHIGTTAANPAPAQPGVLSYSAEDARTDKSKPLSYHWYVSPQTKEAPPQELAGKTIVDVSGRKGYDFGTGATIAMPSHVAGLWVVWYQAKDDQGADVGEASYLQTILGADEVKALAQYDKYIDRVDEYGGKVSGDKVPVTGVHVSSANANETRLRLFIGKQKGDPSKFVLVDLTPGLDPKTNRLEYTSSTGQGVIDELLNENKYPKGQLKLRVADNTIGVPTTERVRETTGMGTFDRLSSGLSIGGMVALGAGIVLAPFTRGQSLQVAMVVSGALTAAGAAVSLYERLQNAEVSGTGVALDVVMIASSLINAGGAVKSLKAGPAVLLSNRATKFLLWTNFAADGVSALLISVEGATQLADIMDTKMPPEQKRAAVIRVVTNLIMAGAMLALSYGQLKGFRKKMETTLGKALAKDLGDDVCMTLAVLDDATLTRMKTVGKDDLGRLASAIREEPALMNVLKSEQRLAKILPLMKGGSAEDLKLAIMRANAHEAGVSVANSERLATVMKSAKIDPGLAARTPSDVLGQLGSGASLGQLESIGTAAASGKLKGYEEWMSSLLGKKRADIEEALSWATEVRKASAHDKSVLDLSGKDAATNTIIKERSDLRWQMNDKNRRLTEQGQPPRYTDLDANVNTGMDNVATARANKHPYGFKDQAHFEGVGAKLKADIAAAPAPPGGRSVPTNEVVVQGSAVHKPDAKDVDIAIMVTPGDFNQLVEQSFPREVAKVRARGLDPFSMTKAQAANSAEKTLAHAVETGKITRDKLKPKLSDVRKSTEDSAGIAIDLSVIKKGGPFDHGPYFPFP